MIKTLIIRLKDNEHSCQMALECKEQAAKFGIQAEYFDAINGFEADRHYEITGVPRPIKAIKKGKPGVLGCFFSHYYLWKKCFDEQIPICILEHDGYFIRSLPEDILDRFDDVLKLDGRDPYSPRYNQVIEQEFNLDLSIEKYLNPEPKAIHKIGTGNYFKGAYSYILKPSGAEKIINFIHENENGRGHRPADQQIGDAVLDTRVTVPTVARLHPFYSIGTNINSASLTKNLSDNIK